MSKKSFQAPDMYFESTWGFRKRPSDVKKEEHFCSKWNTSHLYCLESGEAGTYLVHNLHNQPHYQYHVKDRAKIKKEAENKGITYKFSNKKKFVKNNDLYHYTNESTEYKTHVEPLIDKFDLDGLADMMLDVHKHEMKKKSAADRGTGNVTRSVGYAALNFRMVTNANVPTFKVTGPMPKKILQKKMDITSC